MPDALPDLLRTAIDVRDVLDALWLGAWIARAQPAAGEAAPPAVSAGTVRSMQGPLMETAPAIDGAPSAIAIAPTLVSEEPTSRVTGALYAPGGTALAQSEATTRARPIRIPAGSALPNSLAIARATRAIPARLPSRVDVDLDEDATVDASTRGFGIVPVFRPRLERWFEAALVVDHSPSSEVWAETVIELERMLKLTGIFRDVRTFRLERAPPLRLLNESGVPRRLNALRDPTARRIVFLFSPGVTESWADGTFGRLISDWGASTPVALLHALPRRLWTGTILGEPVALATNSTPGGPNAGLKWRRAWWAQARRIDGVSATLPVLALDPESTRRWAEMFAARRGRSAPAFLVPVLATRDLTSRKNRPQPSLQERVDLFRAHAPDAFKLAVRLAVGPFTMPILRLVQSSLFGRDAEHSQVAELMLSGLVTRLTPVEAAVAPEQVQFQFTHEATPLLLESLRRDDARQLAALLQGYIEQHFGTARDQIVLLEDPEGPAVVPVGARPFAQLNERFVRWLEGSSPRAPASSVTPTLTKAVNVPEVIQAGAATEGERGAAPTPRVAFEFGDRSLFYTFTGTRVPPLKGVRILWVDDQPSNNIAEVAQFRGLGVDITAVTSTAAAVETLESTSADIMLTDLMRPEGKVAGLELLAEARRRWPHMPVILYDAELALSSHLPGAFGMTNDRNTLQSLVVDASPATPARRFVRHYRAELDRSESLARIGNSLLNDAPETAAANVASAVMAPKQRLEAAVTALSAFSQSEYVQLFQFKENMLRLAAERIAPGLATYSIASFEGLIGTAALKKMLVWAPDVSKVPNYIAAERSTQSELVIPIFDEDGVVSFVINIERNVLNAYSTAQIEWLDEFARAYPFSTKSTFRYWFYVSHSRADRDRELEQFLEDVGEEVRALTGADGVVGFHDQRLMKPEEPITDAVVQELRDSRTLLAIITPRYLESKWCQFEWAAFDEAQLGDQQAILPVVWTPLPPVLPGRFARIQVTDLRLPPAWASDYSREGLRSMVRRDKMREEYRFVVARFAARLVEMGSARNDANTVTPVEDGGEVGQAVRSDGLAASQASEAVVTVLVITTRRRSRSQSGVGAFSSGRGKMTALRAEVSIPPSHRIGESETPSLSRLQVQERTSKHVVITKMEELRLDEVVSLSHGVNPTGGVLFYVPGYTGTYKTNVRRAGVLAHDLAWEGGVLAIDWPSKGQLGADVESALRATSETGSLFSSFGTMHRGNAALIAQDVGVQMALGAIIESTISLDTLLLLQPSMDRDSLRQQLEEISSRVHRTTVYCFTEGWAHSEWDITSSRLLEAGGTLDVSSVDVVDVVGPAFRWPRSLWVDIRSALDGVEPNKRLGLQPRDGGWILQN